MSLPTFPVIASRLQVVHCRGIRPNGQYCRAGDHRRGFYDEAGVIHWSDRQATRAGIRRFLMLRAEMSFMDLLDESPWYRFYLAQRSVPALAALIGVQLPRSLGDDDRAELRAMLAKVPRSDSRRREALEWAR